MSVPTIASRTLYSNCIDQQRAKADGIARGQMVFDAAAGARQRAALRRSVQVAVHAVHHRVAFQKPRKARRLVPLVDRRDRKSTRLNSSHVKISYAVFCLKKKKTKQT